MSDRSVHPHTAFVLTGGGAHLSTVQLLSALLHQLEALQHAEAVLLIYYHQPELFEFNFLFDQRVGADHQLGISLSNVPADLAFAIFFERTGQKNNSIPRRLQNPARRKIMLLCKNFRRRHERDLISVFDGNDGGFECDQGLARSHVALQQTAHGIGLLHVRRDFLERSLLRSGGMKRQNFLYCFPHGIIQFESNSGLRLLLAAL